MISTLTQAGAEMTLEALEIGAVDFIAKPTNRRRPRHGGARGRTADQGQGGGAHAGRARARPAQASAASAATQALNRPTNKIVVIGASTGGVEALKEC